MDIADYERTYGIRCYRCCLCPQRDCDNQVCPTGPLKETETVCDFVLYWETPNNTMCKVIEAADGLFGVYECTYQDGILVPKDRIDDIPFMDCFDKAQEHLNMYAADHNWVILTTDRIEKRGGYQNE